MAKDPATPPPATDPSTRAAPEIQSSLQQGLALHGQGRLIEAKAAYESVLAREPGNFDALNGLGGIALQTGDLQAAVTFLGRAAQTNSTIAAVHNNLGSALLGLSRREDALASYDRAIALSPEHAGARYNRGNVLLALARPDAALESYDKAIALRPEHAETHNNRGSALHALKRLPEALASFDRTLALKADHAEAHHNRAAVLRDLKRLQEAVTSYDSVLALKPDHFEALCGKADTLSDLKRLDEAVVVYDKALAVRPDTFEICFSRGNALLELRRFDEALVSFDAAVALQPEHAEAHSNRGITLQELGRTLEALASFNTAIALKPDLVGAYVNRGNAQTDLGLLELAADSYETALTLAPDFAFLLGTAIRSRTSLCDWAGLTERLEKLRSYISAGKRVSTPYPLLLLLDEPELQLRAATTYAQATFTTVAAPIAPWARRDKIRIGYYSADFRIHPTAYLMAELFELHDRTRFEVIGFSLGPRRDDEMRRRISAAFDQFHDVERNSDREIAALSRDLGIDIAVDLNGYTEHGRPGIFALRCAPVQVSYLVYPGTTGATHIDYFIADKIVIPPERQGDFAEKIVYLPHCYQVTDSHRRISDRLFSRAELGLPEAGFVFCNFNANRKILPATFDIWMRLLRAVAGSVLWLLEDNPVAARNLRKEAIARGIDESRLVFGGRFPSDQHLARHHAADLFLDTLPYNAHTTASDAVWAGLPVLTCAGRGFQSRVATSVLHAVGLPELATSSVEAYEAKARELAADRSKLAALRSKLQANRLAAPLFDTPQFAKHIEAAYGAMYERIQARLPAQGFTVDALDL